jgi:hypothetical protein
MSDQQHLVIDVPESVTPEEAAQLLNAPGDVYMLVQVLPVPGGHRAFLRRYKQAQPTKAEAVEAAKDDATALSIVRANREQPIRKIVDVLAKAGIKRGRQWVCDQLEVTCAEDGREEEAIEIVKNWAQQRNPPSNHWVYGPKEVVMDLRDDHKIKRSAAWARRKLEEFRAVRPQPIPKADKTGGAIKE